MVDLHTYKEGKSWWAYLTDENGDQVGLSGFAATKKRAIQELIARNGFEKCTKCGAIETYKPFIKASHLYPELEKPFICSDCFQADLDKEMEETFNEGRWMEHQMKGHEVWTHHANLEDVIGVDGSVCVGIVGERRIMYNGEEYEVSIEQAADLWKDVVYGEYGTTDEKAIARIEGLDKL